MQEFQGRVAIVTGAASGIGLALCQVFAEQGMKIVLADVEQEALTAAADSIEALGAECLAAVCDVSDPEAVEELAALSEPRADRVDHTEDRLDRLIALLLRKGILNDRDIDYLK